LYTSQESTDGFFTKKHHIINEVTGEVLVPNLPEKYVNDVLTALHRVRVDAHNSSVEAISASYKDGHRDGELKAQIAARVAADSVKVEPKPLVKPKPKKKAAVKAAKPLDIDVELDKLAPAKKTRKKRDPKIYNGTRLPVTISGITYTSITDAYNKAGKTLGLSYSQLREIANRRSSVRRCVMNNKKRASFKQKRQQGTLFRLE
jgi:hypothetical protein